MDRLKSVKQFSYEGVLFLQGVFKKDCKQMEDIFQDRLMKDTVPSQETKIYDKLPVNFTTLNDWPKSTNLTCWHCHRQFKTRPWFEPQSIEPVSNGNIGNILSSDQVKKSVNKKSISIVAHGVFCKSNCVKAYIDTYTRDLSERHNKTNMLKYIYEIFTGTSIPDIQPSPSPTEMIQYGGNLSAAEYQHKIDTLDAAYMKELEDNNFATICQMYLRNLHN